MLSGFIPNKRTLNRFISVLKQRRLNEGSKWVKTTRCPIRVFVFALCLPGSIHLNAGCVTVHYNNLLDRLETFLEVKKEPGPIKMITLYMFHLTSLNIQMLIFLGFTRLFIIYEVHKNCNHGVRFHCHRPLQKYENIVASRLCATTMDLQRWSLTLDSDFNINFRHLTQILHWASDDDCNR